MNEKQLQDLKDFAEAYTAKALEKTGVKLEENSGACTYYALGALVAIAQAGPAVCAVDTMRVVGGTLHWPANKEVNDPSTGFFTYQWSPDDLASKLALIQGQLPEMHIWLEVNGKIFDPSLDTLPQRYNAVNELAKQPYRWNLQNPPPIVYGTKEEIEEQHGAFYIEEQAATNLARSAVVSIFELVQKNSN